MKLKVSVGSALIVTVAIFLIILVITKLFQLEELPIQTVGVLFGGVITALITYFLLLGQTQAEENKERNVKVFEEKSKLFNDFITLIWGKWSNGKLTLEEVKEIFDFMTTNLVIYLNKDESQKIYQSIDRIIEKNSVESNADINKKNP